MAMQKKKRKNPILDASPTWNSYHMESEDLGRNSDVLDDILSLSRSLLPKIMIILEKD